MRAYLDIETSWKGSITILGIYVPGRMMLQLVGDEVTAENLLWYLTGASEVVTYNGTCFDLPVIKAALDVDLKEHLIHDDLMYRCWKQNLKGGFKAVERQLGIVRRHPAMDGRDAMQLWQMWRHAGEEPALRQLLEYNTDDCVNLCYLEAALEGSEPTQALDHDYITLPSFDFLTADSNSEV